MNIDEYQQQEQQKIEHRTFDSKMKKGLAALFITQTSSSIGTSTLQLGANIMYVAKVHMYTMVKVLNPVLSRRRKW